MPARITRNVLPEAEHRSTVEQFFPLPPSTAIERACVLDLEHECGSSYGSLVYAETRDTEGKTGLLLSSQALTTLADFTVPPIIRALAADYPLCERLKVMSLSPLPFAGAQLGLGLLGLGVRELWLPRGSGLKLAVSPEGLNSKDADSDISKLANILSYEVLNEDEGRVNVWQRPCGRTPQFLTSIPRKDFRRRILLRHNYRNCSLSFFDAVQLAAGMKELGVMELWFESASTNGSTNLELCFSTCALPFHPVSERKKDLQTA